MATSEHVCKGVIADIEPGAAECLQEAPGWTQLGKAELKFAFITLRAKGLSLRKIANRLRVSKTTLANWNRELEAEIASLRAMELEALQEQYGLHKEGRIKILGGLIKKLQQEVLSRDLSAVPTDKLLELLLKYHAAVLAEQVEPRPLSSEEIQELGARSSKKLSSEAIAKGLEQTLQRYKAGLITVEQARQEMSLLLAALRAQEQAVLAVKLERLEAVIGGRA